MSGRKLGGGRVLGSGKGIAPPAPAGRAMSPFAPSDSSSISLSRNSTTPNSASPPTSDFLADHLTSNVVLRGPANGASASSSRLVCPICNEEMVTLLQLNRHLDDEHQELPEAEQDEVKTWFDKQVLKAKRFQPLTLLNSKLRGLDVFESNESQPVPAPTATVARPTPDTAVMDPEELVTRKHWQRSTGNDVCTDPACDRRLGPMNGSVNCRKCGRLFCEAHTMYQMKLSRSALHEPVRGIWCRVCETCFKSREGYNDHDGLTRDMTSEFAAIRSKRVDRNKLETQRLEKRLTKLTRLLAEAPPDVVAANSSLLSPVSAALPGQKNLRKLIEQSVVAWEDDARVPRCPFCQQEFGSWTFRRHHCRICGRVVCADPATACSGEIGLNVANPSVPPSEKLSASVEDGSRLSVDIRMCRDCKTTIFAHQDFVDSVTSKPPDQRAYETLRQFERGIRSLMPSFQRALIALQPSDADAQGHPDWPPPTHAQIQEAAKIRKRLIDSFAKYDVAAKRIRDLKTTSPNQLRLQKAVHAAASSFLHANLIPLKNLPKILKNSQQLRHPSSSLSSASTSSLSSALGPRRPGLPVALSPLRNGESYVSDGIPETASLDGGASEVSVQLEAEEKAVRERLVVLEEQRFIVNEMLTNARAARRFEEATTLACNLEELDREVESSRRLVSGVEERWEGLYSGAMA